MIERYGTGIIKMREETNKHPFVELEIRTRPFVTEVVFRKINVELDELDKIIINLRKHGYSIGKIAEKLGKSKSTIHRRIKRLEKLGFL